MTWRPWKTRNKKSELNEQGIWFAGKNKYNILTIDKSEEVDNSIITFSPCQEASSGCLECGQGFSLVLDSSFKTHKKIEDEIPEETRITKSIKSDKEIVLKIEISLKGKKSFISTEALLDSGANIIFIDQKWARDKNIPLTLLWNLIPMFNVDGTKNSAGNITHSADIIIDYQDHCEKVTAEVMDFGKNQVILGYTWLKKHNPDIDWTNREVKMICCPWSCYLLQEKSIFLQTLKKEEVEQAWFTHKIWITLDKPKKVEKTVEELVPKEYHKYLKVFLKEESERMLIRKPWDHAIELKDMFKLKKGRLILLSHEEQEEVSVFIDDQLRKGYIQPSKSKQTSPVFFIPKKDGKMQIVQDYHYLNEHTVKNNYPLPLIVQLVNKLQGTKMFTKIDLRWGYNSICIKEGDKWKAALIRHHSAFKSLVMFFGLCNSPSTFQTMMNEIFADMEDIVVVYIDNIMIFTKTNDLKKHDKLC